MPFERYMIHNKKTHTFGYPFTEKEQADEILQSLMNDPSVTMSAKDRKNYEVVKVRIEII